MLSSDDLNQCLFRSPYFNDFAKYLIDSHHFVVNDNLLKKNFILVKLRHGN